MRDTRTMYRCNRVGYRDGIDLYIVSKAEGGFGVHHLQAAVFHRDGEMWPGATAQLTMDEAQELIDELWRAGVRPTEGGQSVGALAATERHLADMQKLVFGPKRSDSHG